MHSHTDVTGKFKPCCNADVLPDKIFRENDYTFNEWFHHPEMDQLRSDLLNGIENPMCGVCWEQERTGTNRSFRYGLVERFRKDNIDTSNPKITYLDLKLSNECNLGCRMCNYTESTQIHKDMQSMEQQKMTLPSQWKRIERFEGVVLGENKSNMFHTRPQSVLDEVYELLPNIKYFKVTGGEPTIMKEFIDLVNYIIDKQYAKNIVLSITTNGTRLTPEFIEKLKPFKKLRINVSVDGFKDNYEYIRYPMSWKIFDKRMKTLSDDINSPKSNITEVNFTIVSMMQNIENISKLENYIWETFKGNDDVSVQIQTNLRPFSSTNDLRFLPKHILQQALTDSRAVNSKTKYHSNIYHSTLKDVISNYGSEEMEFFKKTDSLKVMLRDLLNIDKIRNQDYRVGLGNETNMWIDQLVRKYRGSEGLENV
jgi:sulfatase maturation enzyme AslB (radical SAM superfamily)